MSEDKIVSFKITLTENNFDPEFRRFVLDLSGGISLENFREKLTKIFGDRLTSNRNFKLTWTDDEGDKITIQVKQKSL